MDHQYTLSNGLGQHLPPNHTYGFYGGAEDSALDFTFNDGLRSDLSVSTLLHHGEAPPHERRTDAAMDPGSARLESN